MLLLFGFISLPPPPLTDAFVSLNLPEGGKEERWEALIRAASANSSIKTSCHLCQDYEKCVRVNVLVCGVGVGGGEGGGGVDASIPEGF